MTTRKEHMEQIVLARGARRRIPRLAQLEEPLGADCNNPGLRGRSRLRPYAACRRVQGPFRRPGQPLRPDELPPRARTLRHGSGARTGRSERVVRCATSKSTAASGIVGPTRERTRSTSNSSPNFTRSEVEPSCWNTCRASASRTRATRLRPFVNYPPPPLAMRSLRAGRAGRRSSATTWRSRTTL